MNIQNSIGADILMALDDVVSSTSTNDTRFEQATRRTIEWLDRCISAHRRPYQQAMFGIIQGGTDKYLRTTSIEGWLPGSHCNILAPCIDDHMNAWKQFILF